MCVLCVAGKGGGDSNTESDQKVIQKILNNPKAIGAEIAKLEKQMFAYAKDLEFEKAAKTRDSIESLKAQIFIQ